MRKFFKYLFIIFVFMFVMMPSAYADDNATIFQGLCEGDSPDFCFHYPEGSYFVPLDYDNYFEVEFQEYLVFSDSFSLDNMIDTAIVKVTVDSGLSIDNVAIKDSCYSATRSGNTFSFTKSDKNTSCAGGVTFSLKVASGGSSGLKEYHVKVETTVKNSSGTTLASNTHNSVLAVYNGDPNPYEDNTNLKSLKISAGTMTPDFTKDGSVYTINTTSDKLKIDLELESAKSALYYYGSSLNDQDLDNLTEPVKDAFSKEFSIGYGTTNIMYVILSEKDQNRGTKPSFLNNYECIHNACDRFSQGGSLPKTVSFIVNRNDTRSTVNTLKSLSLSSGSITFKPELKFYTVTVANDVTSISINSTLTDSKSYYVQGYGNRKVNLNEGENTILVKVMSEQGKENTYTIMVTRELSRDNTLKEITVNEKNIKINDKDLKYKLNVDNDVEKVEVKATANNEKAVVDIANVETLSEGSNKITITVTAPNGDKKIYELDVVRDSKVSSNSNLKSLSIKGYKLDFSSNVKEYSIKIEDEKELDITAECDNSKAKYIVTGNKDLENGSVIKIKVTAEDGSDTIYEIKIEKEKKAGFPIIIPIAIGAVLVIGIIASIVLKGKKKKVVSSLKSAEVVQEEPAQTETHEETNEVKIEENVSEDTKE